MTLLLHAASTCYLAGVTWLIQLVVYPGFLVVGPHPEWTRFHAEHSRRIVWVVGPAWLVEGVSLTVLLALGRGAWWLLGIASVCASATVALTVFGAVPLHRRLAAYDVGLARRLLRASAWRTAAWTAGAAASVALVLLD